MGCSSLCIIPCSVQLSPSSPQRQRPLLLRDPRSTPAPTCSGRVGPPPPTHRAQSPPQALPGRGTWTKTVRWASGSTGLQCACPGLLSSKPCLLPEQRAKKQSRATSPPAGCPSARGGGPGSAGGARAQQLSARLLRVLEARSCQEPGKPAIMVIRSVSG